MSTFIKKKRKASCLVSIMFCKVFVCLGTWVKPFIRDLLNDIFEIIISDSLKLVN